MAQDRFHQVVKTALAKDGWNVTHDPLQIKVGGVDMEIDLGAERLLAAERGDEKIAVEVKSFLASATEHDIAANLVDLGVPKQDIVLGFHPPFMREMSDYAAG